MTMIGKRGEIKRGEGDSPRDVTVGTWTLGVAPLVHNAEERRVQPANVGR